MTELMIRDEAQAPALNDRQQPITAHTAAGAASLNRLSDWDAELIHAGSIAQKLCQTPFVPEHFRNKPADAAGAILTGFEMGLSPMASLRSIFMIKGNPGMYAKMMVAVAQSQGHEIWIEEQSPERAVVCGQRKGSTHIFRTTWDRDRAVQAKLTGNAKYQENPQAMYVARGQAEIARQVAPDALHGIPYAVEELADFDDRPVRAEVVTPTRVSMADLAQQAEPELPEQEMITDAQQRKLRAVLSDLGLGGKDDRDQVLKLVSDFVARPVSSSKELTKNAAMVVIDKFEDMLAARRKREAQDAAAEVVDADEWPETAEVVEG